MATRQRRGRNPRPAEQVPNRCVYFFDGETGAAICPEDLMLDFKLVGGERWVQQEAELLKDGPFRGRYSINWQSLCTRRLRCDPDSAEVHIRLHETIEYNLGRYASQVILASPCASRHYAMTDEESEEGNESQLQGCCCIPIPLFRLQETCVVKFKAYDTSFDDFVENAEAFLDNVEVTATAVQTPPPPIASQGSTALTRTSLTGAFLPGTFSSKTVQGSGELAGLVRNQLYTLDVRGLAGYVMEGDFPQYLYTCCECDTELVFRFRPCGKYPNRSLIFVRQECSGIRWENNPIEVQGRALHTNDRGYLAIPKDMVGVAQLSYPGKVFNPTQIDLTANSNVVTVVTVADQAQLSPVSSHQFVDDSGVPFKFRKLTAVLPSGDTVQIVTDNQGRFEAPAGSIVYAEDDAFGLATEPILVSGLSGE